MLVLLAKLTQLCTKCLVNKGFFFLISNSSHILCVLRHSASCSFSIYDPSLLEVIPLNPVKIIPELICKIFLENGQSFDQILDWILAAFWLYFNCILTVFWLHFGCILPAFYLHFDCILTVFWPIFGYILTAFWLQESKITKEKSWNVFCSVCKLIQINLMHYWEGVFLLLYKDFSSMFTLTDTMIYELLLLITKIENCMFIIRNSFMTKPPFSSQNLCTFSFIEKWWMRETKGAWRCSLSRGDPNHSLHSV